AQGYPAAHTAGHRWCPEVAIHLSVFADAVPGSTVGAALRAVLHSSQTPYPDASEMRPYLQSHSFAFAYAYAYYLHRDTIGRAEFVVGRHAARSNSRLSRSCTAVLLANSPPLRAQAAMRRA